MSDQVSRQALRPPRRVGSVAIAAPLIAPTEVPDHEVGHDPALEQRAQHPGLVRAELPPPPSTNATVIGG